MIQSGYTAMEGKSPEIFLKGAIMGMFIQVKIDNNKCQASSNECRECINICPVDVFQFKEGKIAALPDNEDECTLCYICEERCPPKAIKVVKLY